MRIILLLSLCFILSCSAQRASRNLEPKLVEGVFFQDFFLDNGEYWVGLSFIKTDDGSIYNLENKISGLDVECFKNEFSKGANIYENNEMPKWIPGGTLLENRNLYKSNEKITISFEIISNIKKIILKDDSCRNSLQVNTCNKIDFDTVFYIEKIISTSSLSQSKITSESLTPFISKNFKFRTCN